ncbi:MAG TPA: hypothetical protein VN966_02135 [Candidatus Bathyarchaeia archaeon]|jgi:ElaB/YqjD/DUF883 family membrane-anchored ribosome-binding protein|nr:hypothetical protein [Candidatus Bathyarchaeia archaeon]
MEENDKSSFLGKARERLMEAGGEVSRLKTEASQAVEDGVVAARRLARRSRYAAEDLIDDAVHRVKRDPLRAMAIGLAIGFGLGALAVWLATHNARE